jgi:Transport protein Avl9
LPPDVHCVSCFRQVDAIDAVTHSASSSVRKEDSSVAARGSVQKSVVLLCRRPLFGFLADRLVQAVREYFDQGDFARTEALASLFHSLNVSLAHPTLALKSTLFQGISLRSLLQALGPQTLAVLKLILLEKRVVLYSHPVYTASSAVVALASLFPGALDTLAPAMPAIDISPDDVAYAMPLALFGPRDRVIFQPYAPLPVVSDLLSTCSLPNSGCLIGTSHNIGVLLASTAVNAARKTASQPTPPNLSSKSQPFQTPPSNPRLQDTAGWESTPRSRQESADAGGSATQVAASSRRASSVTPGRSAATVGFGVKSRSADYGTESGPEIGLRINALPPVDPSVTARFTVGNGTEENLVTPSPRHLRRSSGASDNTASPQQRLSGAVAPSPGRGGGRLPVVDALVNMSTGKVTVAGPIEPLCRITRQERRFLRDLMVAASLPNEDGATTSSATASTGIGPRPGTEEYIRARIRAYLVGFLGCVASVRGILGGPRGSETWNAEVVSHFDLSSMGEYNERFVHAWLQTRSAAQWSRRCSSVAAVPRSVPAPELDDSLADDPLLPVAVDRVAAGLSGIREFVSSKAVEGISSLFSRLETELGRIETAIGKSIAASPSETPMPLRGAADERLGSRNLEGRSSWQANAHRDDPTLRTTRSTPSVFPPDAISGASTVPAVARGRSADISLGKSRTTGSDPV